jgi:hypothetical protein|tara:strand:+ start:1202 stop:1672 length:471 start_codon:yes stop_codon:yes gene_type:complete
MKTHWKKLKNPDYIGSYELMTGEEKTDLVVKVLKVEKKLVKGTDGSDSECIIAELENQKPMILNSTNAKVIEKLANSPFIEDWNGLKITLYVKRIKAFGEMVDALRIRESAPLLPELTPEHERWNGALEGLANGSVTIKQIKASFRLSVANEKLLK